MAPHGSLSWLLDAVRRFASTLANVARTQSAPVVTIVGQDMALAQRLPRLFAPQTAATSCYEGKLDLVSSTALRNSSLRGGT